MTPPRYHMPDIDGWKFLPEPDMGLKMPNDITAITPEGDQYTVFWYDLWVWAATDQRFRNKPMTPFTYKQAFVAYLTEPDQ